MNYGGLIIPMMIEMVNFFQQRCAETSTLGELATILTDKSQWPKAHDLFGRIRQKSHDANRNAIEGLMAQYRFEVMCAKTLYNLSGRPAPFDQDSPFFVVPNAIALARCLGVKDLGEISDKLSTQPVGVDNGATRRV